MNPFVNPHQRGIDLPPGCKDLIDTLNPSVNQSAPEFEPLRGSDAEYFEAPFHRFYELEIAPIIVIFVRTSQSFLSLSRHPQPPHLDFGFEPTQTALKDTIRDFFRAKGVSPLTETTVRGYFAVSYPLPATALQAAELISQLLQQVYHTDGPIELAHLPPPKRSQ